MEQKKMTEILKGKVEAISQQYGGGIKLEQGWVNGLDPNTFKKGDIVELEVLKNSRGGYELQKVLKQEHNEAEDDMISFSDLLNTAHEKGIDFVRTELVQVNMEQKWALFKATVKLKDGREFTAHGDATQENTGEFIKEHFFRFAETRAFARALRFATNENKVADVELKKGDKPAPKPGAKKPEDDGTAML